MPVPKELIEILVCPKCKGELEYREREDVFICPRCSLVYEVKDDIPIMLIEEAIPLQKWQREKT